MEIASRPMQLMEEMHDVENTVGQREDTAELGLAPLFFLCLNTKRKKIRRGERDMGNRAFVCRCPSV
jgi:hypothetical protein